MRQPRFEVYPDAGGEWRWRLVARNGRIVAESGEGYKRRYPAVRAAYTVKGVARDAAWFPRVFDSDPRRKD